MVGRRYGVVVVAAMLAAASIALGLVPAATRAASPPVGGSQPILVSSDTHHDTSRPLRSYKPTTTQESSHPAKRDNSHSQGPAAADTSGGHLAPTVNAPAATNNFDGTPDNSGLIPADPTGAVGTTQYVEMVNSQIAVYNKSGGKLLGPENTNTLFTGFNGSCSSSNSGDGTVQFDSLSQRWVVQQMQVAVQPFDICVAVSTSADATGTWNRYSFQYNDFPDYPKFGVWPDAYYVTVNRFDASGSRELGEETCALNRAAMLSGSAASTQCFSLTSSGLNTVLPATMTGATPPAAGTPEWLVGIAPTTSNALAYWRLHVDWTTPSNSALSAETDLAVNPFGDACGTSGTCVPQSGTTQLLDSLGDRLMNSLPYRNFGGDHESIMATHSITAGSSVGMRWYELRPSGSTLSVFQQGTYAPDGTYRWMGSIGMDQLGDVALGYSTSSSSLHPGIAYTGRLASDPAGTMPQGETTLFTGGGSQMSTVNVANRWGDYSGMSVDPTDNCTFWYVNQYIPTNGDFNWHTRIGSFKFPSCGAFTNDFSISANPSSLILTQNTTGSSTISTTVTSGSGSVALSLSGTPAGATASLTASSVTAGGNSTLNVGAGTATPGGYTLTVTGTEGAATHMTTVALTITGGAGAVVTNGGFETGTLSSWTTGGAFSPTVTTAQRHSGTDAAQLGASSGSEPVGDSSLTQTITVPAGSSTLSFWYWASTTDSITYDWQEAQIRNTSGTTLTSVMKVCSNAQAWTHVTFDMTPYAGQNVQLYFNAHGDGYGDLTYMYLDDVSVTQNAPPPNDFSISAAAFSPASVAQGGSATSAITTAVTSGSAQSIGLSASGLPVGATASFSPTSVTAGAGSTLTVATSSTTPAGTYPITITGTGASATHTASASLTVAGSDFSISANPTTLSLAQNTAGSSTITTAVTSGAAGTVALSVSGTPSGATAAVTPTSVTAGQTSALNVNAGTATPGTYQLTVTGTEGSQTHSATVTLTVVTNNFSISASPTGLTLAQNAAGSSTISTAVTSGNAGTVALSVSGTPSGATASLAASSVTAGTNTTLNVNAGTATPGGYTLTVTGTEGTATHTATVALTITGTGGPVVTNGGFETGTLSSWTTGGVFSPTVTTSQKHSGSDAAQLGGSSGSEPNGDSSLLQTITVPAGSSTLSFWYWASTTDSITYDWQEAQIRNTSGTTLTSVMKVCSNAQAWTQVTFNLSPYAGQNVQLYFNVHGDGYGDLTYMHLDDVSVTQNTSSNDFSISAAAFSPASVAQGGSATSAVTTAVTSGSAQSVSLSASGLPAGATASFSPTSVTAGGAGSTLTVATSSTTPVGTYPITITGTGASATHTTSASLTVTGSNVVTNGGFETGTLSSWTTGGVFSPTVTTAQKHSGSDAAQLGGSSGSEPNGDSSLLQTITVPAGNSTLSFWYWASTTDSITYDWQEAQIRNTSGTTLTSVMKVCSNAQAWTQVTFNLSPYAGQTVQLYFNVHGDGYGDLTYMYLDDVSVTATAAPSVGQGHERGHQSTAV